MSRQIATAAHEQGWIDSLGVKSIDKQEADKCTRLGSALWGANSRARAKRARAALHWQPKGPSVWEEIHPTIEIEAENLGLKPGHAKVAAGEA